MKKTILLFLMIFTLSLALPSCSNDSSNSSSPIEKFMKRFAKKNKVKKVGKKALGNNSKEYDSKYICTQHCDGSGSDAEGECPGCSSTYVLNENYKATK